MNNIEKYYDKFNAYLTGALTVEEKSGLEAEIMQDDTLKSEFLLFQGMTAGVSAAGKDNLYAKLNQFHDEFGFDEPTPEGSKLKWLGILGAIALIVLGAYFLGLFSGSTSDPIEKNMEAPILALVTRDSPKEEEAKIISELWQKADYSQLIDRLKTSELTPPADNNYIMALAYSYLETKEFDLAEGEFQRVLDSGDVLLKDQALFYLGLTYLQTNRKAEARTVLQGISSRAGKKIADGVKELLPLTE